MLRNSLAPQPELTPATTPAKPEKPLSASVVANAAGSATALPPRDLRKVSTFLRNPSAANLRTIQRDLGIKSRMRAMIEEQRAIALAFTDDQRADHEEVDWSP